MKYFQKQESFVCVGNQPKQLRYSNIISPVKVYSYDYNNNMQVIEYVQDKDFVIKNGLLIRTDNSAMPDYKTSPFYNQQTFTHVGLKEYGNAPYMLYADYQAQVDPQTTPEEIAVKISKNNGNYKILYDYFCNFNQKNFNLLIFGDSISVGGGTTNVEYSYFSRFIKLIEQQFNLKVNLTNLSIAGESSRDGLLRYKTEICKKYDLMILAYGMNDQNLTDDAKQNVCPQEYKSNLKTIVEHAAQFGTPTLLVTSCLPNPRWKFANPKINDFFEQARQLSKEKNLPLCDLASLWQQEINYKSFSDLLENDINHPSNYGHYLYFCMLKTLL